jgi:3-isopropylmalate/(R)-2-methylmalate dehydratase small subunit
MRAQAHCVDGVLDVDWDISPIEDMFFVRDAAAERTSYDEQLKKLAEHCLTRVDPEFPLKVQPGDILVGNRGVGWGHGHDHAALALKAVGIGAILCETTGVNFKRNCINHGLPLIEIPAIFSKVNTGDTLEIDLDTGTLRNISRGLVQQFVTYPEFILKILDAGGIYRQMRNEIESKNITARQTEETL